MSVCWVGQKYTIFTQPHMHNSPMNIFQKGSSHRVVYRRDLVLILALEQLCTGNNPFHVENCDGTYVSDSDVTLFDFSRKSLVPRTLLFNTSNFEMFSSTDLAQCFGCFCLARSAAHWPCITRDLLWLGRPTPRDWRWLSGWHHCLRDWWHFSWAWPFWYGFTISTTWKIVDGGNAFFTAYPGVEEFLPARSSLQKCEILPYGINACLLRLPLLHKNNTVEISQRFACFFFPLHFSLLFISGLPWWQYQIAVYLFKFWVYIVSSFSDWSRSASRIS